VKHKIKNTRRQAGSNEANQKKEEEKVVEEKERRKKKPVVSAYSLVCTSLRSVVRSMCVCVGGSHFVN